MTAALNKFNLARLMVVLLFAIVTMLQLVALPAQTWHHITTHPSERWFDLALLALLLMWFLAAQISLVLIWRILGYMQHSDFFSQRTIHVLEHLLTQFRLAFGVSIALLLVIGSRANDQGPLVLLTAVTLFLGSLWLMTTLVVEQIRTKVQSL